MSSDGSADLPGQPAEATAALEAAGTENGGGGTAGSSNANTTPFAMPPGGALPFPADGEPAWGDNPGGFAWPAVVKNGEVFVHYMHIAANQAANGGKIGSVAQSGWVWLDELGTVMKVRW